MKTGVRGTALLIWALMFATCARAEPLTPIEHRRGEEQTYLTFPEWFLVFSPAEYAEYVAHDQPSNFPFWGHVRQLWQSYAAVTQATVSNDHPFNGGYHVMIMVIGVSTTVEYGLRCAYETIIGRLAELTSTGRTAEDEYAARIAQEYVDFIRERPWYEFDFWGRLRGLWRDVPATGDGLVRKWERRYALTSEYLVKAGYGWLLAKATHASYERPLMVTAVAVTKDDVPQVRLLPRYEAFTGAAMRVAMEGAQFVEIAGNPSDADILVSVLVRENWRAPPTAKELFTQPILTQPGIRRVALVVPVNELAAVLREFVGQSQTRIEHVFDY